MQSLVVSIPKRSVQQAPVNTSHVASSNAERCKLSSALGEVKVTSTAKTRDPSTPAYRMMLVLDKRADSPCTGPRAQCAHDVDRRTCGNAACSGQCVNGTHARSQALKGTLHSQLAFVSRFISQIIWGSPCANMRCQMKSAVRVSKWFVRDEIMRGKKHTECRIRQEARLHA